MEKKIKLTSNYLKIPVIRNGEECEVSFFVEGEKVWQFRIPVKTAEKGVGTGGYAQLPVGSWKGKVMTLETDGTCLPENILQSDEPESGVREGDVYPRLHFTPVSGWMNDPNGLCFYQGEYHLFFQHNMFDVEWNNLSWGHAVSRDLLHWTQLEEALLPDEEGTMFSGCAFANFRGESICPKDGLLLFYTCAGGSSKWSEGQRFTQKAAFSTDGRSFQKLPEVLVPHIVKGNRDPKVGWMEETGTYYMVLFLFEHTYAVFTSKDLREWKETQRLEIPESWECPDLICFPEQGGTKRWLFWTSDGYYLVGSFDGEHFTAEQKVRCLYGNPVAYAAQTFWGTDRNIQVPWLRVRWEDKPYQGAMGIPRELELTRQDGEYVLAAHLPRELWEQQERFYQGSPDGGQELTLPGGKCVVAAVRNPDRQSFELKLGAVLVAWEEETGRLKIEDEEFSLPGMENMNLVLDRDLLEVSCKGDTVCFYRKTQSGDSGSESKAAAGRAYLRGAVNMALGVL